jgi:hypothetical protein
MQRLVGDAELVAAPDLAARQHDALLDIVCVACAQSRSRSACFSPARGNDQQAATLLYHDHALGMTRLNVYAGLAGFYVLEDQNRLDLVKLCSDFASSVGSRAATWSSSTAGRRDALTVSLRSRVNSSGSRWMSFLVNSMAWA